MIIGIDCDGVLANFNEGFRQRLIDVSGRELVPPGYMPNVWDWPQAVGYTQDETNRAWDSVKADPTFWQDLKPLDGAPEFLDWLWRAVSSANWTKGAGHEVYFMTTRLGHNVKRQTENWLLKHGFGGDERTVLICRTSKAYAAMTLGLTHFVDDRDKNVDEMLSARGNRTRVYLRLAPDNERAVARLTADGARAIVSLPDLRAALEVYI
jgi:hypothetical protein